MENINYKTPTRQQENELLQQIQNSEPNENLNKKLLIYYYKFIKSSSAQLAKKYHLEIAECVNIGFLGLYEAAKRFDTTQNNNRFLSFAIHYINGYIIKLVLNNHGLKGWTKKANPTNTKTISIYNSNKDEIQIIDRLKDETSTDNFKQVLDKINVETIKKETSTTLNPFEQFLINECFCNGKTTRGIKREFKISLSVERIRQIKNQALQKIKKEMGVKNV